MKRLTLKAMLAGLACCAAALCAGAPPARAQNQSAAPPDVVFTSPDESATPVEQEELTVRLTVLSYDIPLTRIIVTLNGGKVFEKVYEVSPSRDRVEFTVKLRPGTNELKAVATNKLGDSKPAVRNVSYEPPVESGDSNLYVLSIGIAKYGSPEMSLKFARSDAEEVGAAFADLRGRRPFRNVQTKVLTDEHATREAVLDGLMWLNKTGGGERDLRVVFVAGLTTQFNGTDYLLSPLDDSPAGSPANDLRLGLIWEALSSRQGTAVVFGDVVLRDVRLAPAPGAAISQMQTGRPTSYVWDGSVNSFIAAIQDGVPLADGAWGHSAFAKALIEGLAGKADPGGGCVDLDELSDWLDKSVRKLTDKRQSVFVLLQKKDKDTKIACHGR